MLGVPGGGGHGRGRSCGLRNGGDKVGLDTEGRPTRRKQRTITHEVDI